MRETMRISDRLAEFEERAAAIYLTFARRFHDRNDLSGFWLRMSAEERQHGQFLRFCGCETLLVEGLPENSVVQEIAKLLSDLEERASPENLSLDETFLIAAELEDSEINEVYAGVVRPVVGTSHVIRKKTETLISDHMTALAAAARQFGASALTLEKLAEMEHRKAPQQPRVAHAKS
jgi:hypothetical protein